VYAGMGVGGCVDGGMGVGGCVDGEMSLRLCGWRDGGIVRTLGGRAKDTDRKCSDLLI